MNDEASSKLDAHSYWILDLLVSFRVPFWYFVKGKEAVESQFRRPFHGMNNVTLCKKVCSLINDGLVYIYDDAGETLCSPDQKSLEKIAGNENKMHVLSLTPAGGALWEKVSNVCWAQVSYFPVL